MFIGREKELEILNRNIESDVFELGIVYGRRRIGKTKLLRQVVKKHNAIYYVANEMGVEHNLKQLSMIVAAYYNESFIFDDFEGLFKYLVNKSEKEKTVLIIDEYTYLMETDSEILSVFQNIIDHQLLDSNMKLILSGSHVGMVEDALTYKKPLYGRTTFKMKIQPFDYYDAAKFYPNMSQEDKVRMYSVFGGIPFYISKIDDRKSVKENIIDLIISDGAIFEDEITFFLSQEVRSIATYGKIIQAVASGATKLNEITTKSGSSNSGTVSKHIDTLMMLGILEKEYSFGESEKKRKTIYRIKDQLFHFHYYFIEKNNTQKTIMSPNVFYDTIISEHLDEFVSFEFENVCRDFLKRKERDTIQDIGRYWYNDAKNKVDVEIDVVMKTLHDKIAFECKWTNKKIDRKVISTLQKRAEYIGVSPIGFFSRNGIEEKSEQYVHYTVKDLYVSELE